jgi:hypothetical protein
MRHGGRGLTLLIVVSAIMSALLVSASGASAAKAKKPPSPPPPPAPSTTTTFIKNYADIVNGVEASSTPVDVQPTPDGGTIALSLVPSPSSVGVNWLTKLSNIGAIEWQEELGCLSTAPGDYSDAVSLQLTKDGGYIIAGATIGCGSGAHCPVTSGFTCGLVEKVTSTGAVSFAQVYDLGPNGTSFHAIRQTGDGGYVVAGSETDLNGTIEGLVVKLDANGSATWQSRYVPSSAFQAADFVSVTPASDGGVVAAGRLTANSRFSLSVVEFDANGNLVWQHAYNNLTNGSPSSSVQPLSIITAHDGGYAIAGTYNSTTSPGTCCSGPLLLKLAAAGAIEFQQAYEGAVYCFFNGFGEQCTSIGGVAYAVQQNKDGGFIVAGASNIEMTDGTPLEPWLARVDASGNLIWQENDYRINPQTGRPLSENFAGVAITSAGCCALGATENYANGDGELLGVSTDGDGHVATTCSDEHSTALLSPANPDLVDLTPGLVAVTGAGGVSAPAPVQMLLTGGTASPSQC